ncbi:hypothetical protein [Sphingobium sp. MI1205]|nr:hypothetical protein [Sphingobium sp. MI1205]
MSRAAAFFAVLVAIGVLLLLSAIDFGKLPFTPGRRPDCGEPSVEAHHG